MTIRAHQSENTTKRRGAELPARLRHACRRGVTLVELMISMLILTIVCLAWLEIIGIQSARKEARRREAVERLSGMMDALLYDLRTKSSFTAGTHYKLDLDRSAGKVTFLTSTDKTRVYPVFDTDVSSIGYQLSVVKKSDLPNQERFTNWPNSWLVGRLYESNGSVADAGHEFFMLPVCMGK